MFRALTYQFILFVLTLLVVLCYHGNGVKAFYGYSRLTLFEDANGQGEAFFLRVGSECVDLPAGLRRWASSVNTHGTCVLVCRYSYCRNCIQIDADSPGQGDLRELDFNDQIASVRACEGQDYVY